LATTKEAGLEDVPGSQMGMKNTHIYVLPVILNAYIWSNEFRKKNSLRRNKVYISADLG